MIALIILTTLNLNDTREVINKVLDDWHLAAAKADEDAYFKHLSENSIFLGTDATERWNKIAFRQFAHPYFAKGKAWAFSATRRGVSISDDGKIAWFDEDLKTENLGPARGSGVLVMEKEGWKIVQYNLAITIPNDKFPAVKKLLEESSKGK